MIEACIKYNSHKTYTKINIDKLREENKDTCLK